MFGQLAAQATELWRFALDGEGGKLRLIGEEGGNRLQLQVVGDRVSCLCGFLCALCALCGECFSRFNTKDTGSTAGAEKRSHGLRITSHESRNFMGRTVPTFRQLIDDSIARWSKFRRAPATRGPGIFRPPVSPRTVVHAGGHLSGERQPHGSDSALHRARSGKAAGRARTRRAAAGDGCGLHAPSP